MSCQLLLLYHTNACYFITETLVLDFKIHLFPPMGNQPSQPFSKDLDHSKFIHFLPHEIREWSHSFRIMFPSGKISLPSLNDLFSVLFPFGNVAPFCSRLFSNINISQSGEIELEELLIAFTILFKGSSFERVRWIFRFYDVDNDGFVSRDELIRGLESVNMMISNSTEELNVRRIADEIFQAVKNESGFLSFNDFEILAKSNFENLKKISFFTD